MEREAPWTEEEIQKLKQLYNELAVKTKSDNFKLISESIKTKNEQ